MSSTTYARILRVKINMSDKEQIDKLKMVLKEIFQFENKDLDFGIYRILNVKRNEIAEFIDKELFNIVKQAIANVKDDDELEKKIELLRKEIEADFGCHIEDAVKKYRETPKVKNYLLEVNDLATIDKQNEIQEQIYDDIVEFFSRYYDNGDFISKRRYSRVNKYAVPYNGEEVYLYWANNDQYYVKTNEDFKEYLFKIGVLSVNFETVSEEDDEYTGENFDTIENKSRFFIFRDANYDFEHKKLIIKFHYRPLSNDENEQITKLTEKKRIQKNEVNAYNLKQIQEKIGLYGIPQLIKSHVNADGSMSDLNELQWHLNKYTTKNTSDYFIHKDLKKFLDRELDFYIKNEILHLDNIMQEDDINFNIKRIRAFKAISTKIIDFLSQIEDFQKAIWKKKKFVISTDYVITLDKLKEYTSEDFVKSMIPKILTNEAQIKEWSNLFDITIENETSLVENRTLEDIIYKKLPLDTKNFGDDFKWRLLNALAESGQALDKILDGVLIKSENWQALNTILSKYNGKVKSIYIDPPYNTGSDDFLYKDRYQHSSWLCMMENRLKIACELLQDSGSIYTSIDDNEQFYLGCLMDLIFGRENSVITISIARSSAAGHKTVNATPVNVLDFILVYSKTHTKFDYKPQFTKSDYDVYYSNYIENKQDNYDRWIIKSVGEVLSKKLGFNSETDAREELSAQVFDAKLSDFALKNADRLFEFTRINYNGVGKDIQEVAKLSESNKDKIFQVKREGYDDMYIMKGRKMTFYTIKVKEINGEKTHVKMLTNIWTDIPWNGISHEGRVILNKGKKPEALIKRILDISTEPMDLVLDFFVGSGTTCAVAHKLKRKWIGIEMGDYFDEKAMTRMKNVLSGEQSGISKESNWMGGGFFKYQYLEQYEDSLNNIEFAVPNDNALNSKDYKIKYMLNFETKNGAEFLNLSELDHPFNFKLKFVDTYGTKDSNIDLIETFNYIAGVNVKSMERKLDQNMQYVVVKGQMKGKEVIIVWREKGNDFDPVRDKEFVEKEIIKGEYVEILVNGNSLIKEAKSIDEVFKSNIM